MDDIYSDLENYETENINELKNENQELKCKLEEYASTLSNLQKDFDKLSSEYKKLELNYSSLLKTARAEIDRKTKMITTLNLEKDQLVLNSLQNKGRLLPTKVICNTNRAKESMQKEDKVPHKETILETLKNDSIIKSTNKTDSTTQNNERSKQDRTMCSIPPRASLEVKEKEQNIKTSDPNRDSDKSKIESKVDRDNHTQLLNDKSKIKNNKISQRRKSMPLINYGDFKFSSDEEQDDNPKSHRFRRKSPVRDLPNRKHDKDYNGRNGPRDPDNTRVDDKFVDYRDSFRDFHRGNSRYSDHDKYRSRDNRDKYEINQRNKKHFSPDRSRYHTYRDYSMDKANRLDYVRPRVCHSSPPKYNPTRRSRDFDRQRYPNEEVCAVKHKLYDIVEEPACKRMRSKSVNRHFVGHVTSPQDREIDFYTAPILQSAGSYLSLQSPDYANYESAPTVHKIKEIKGIATTKLDDPRLISNKYKKNTQKGKVELSTVVGRDVDIKLVDISTWNIDKKIYKMPTPLREKPQTSDLFNEICTDVDQHITNLSLESGEIESSEGDILPPIKKHLDTAHKNLNVTNAGRLTPDPRLKSNKSTFSQSHNKESNINSQIKVVHPQTETNDHMEKNLSQLVSNNYTIPKVNPSSINKPIKDTLINDTQKLGKRDSTKQCLKKKTDTETKDIEKRDKKGESSGHNEVKAKYNFRNKSKNEKNVQEKVILSARDTVACDLELSDETSDYCEFPDSLNYDNKNCGLSDDCTKKLLTDSTDKTENLNKLSDHAKTKVEDLKLESLCENKEISTPHTIFAIQFEDPVSKPYQDPNPKDIKTKLRDLFGENSSLITPDDLGIPEPSTTQQILYDYGPLFDNTQNAVDLNVEDMEKVQAQSLKLMHEDSCKINKQEDERSDKKHKNKSNKKDDRKRKWKDSNERPATDDVLEDANVFNKEPNVVKTVIISRGVQNNPEEPTSETGQEKLSVLSKVNNYIPHSETSSSLQALATSTPHKPTLLEPSISVPVISCSSNDMSIKNANNTSSNAEDISVTNKNNVDVPDVRIIVKRRRKAKPS